MALNNAWRELHRARFPELPLDCGRERDPGVIYSEDLRDWSDKPTTPDQVRMELHLDRYDLRARRILHIGIGDSGLARRFHRRTGEIVGTTIDEPEMKVARSLAIPGYRFLIHNKFSGEWATIGGKFDFILDNNPTSPCCCVRHLSDLFDFYCAKLAEAGQVITDQQGLGWVPDETHPRWSFDFDDLAAVASVAGLVAARANENIYLLSRSAPAQPSVASLSRHLLRRAKALPGQIMRKGPPKLVRIVRGTARRVLVATVPWALPKRFRPPKGSGQ